MGFWIPPEGGGGAGGGRGGGAAGGGSVMDPWGLGLGVAFALATAAPPPGGAGGSPPPDVMARTSGIGFLTMSTS